MTFLNPAILFGLFAASIPILIHLLNLRKLKRIKFSTLSFLKELQKKKIRKIKIKQWLLLALRVLLILLLVMAFARPTLETVSFAGLTSSAKTTAVILLDNTYSMSVVSAEGSAFNRAKEKAVLLLNELQEGDNAAVIPFSRFDDVSSLSNNVAALQEELTLLEISPVSVPLHNALRKASELINASDDFNKEIYILSDFQKGRLSDSDEWENLRVSLSEKVKVYIFDYAREDIFNLGITGLSVETEIFERNKPVRFRASVSNYSSRDVSNSVASLYINNKRSAQKSLDISAGSTAEFVIEADVREGGLLDVRLELEDDDIVHDNSFFTTIDVPEQINILLLSEKNADVRFIKTALQAANTNDILAITEKNSGSISAMNLNRFDVVLLCGSLSGNDAGRLQEYIRSGGGAVILPAGDSQMNSFAPFLNALGLPQPQGFYAVEPGSGNEAFFNTIDYRHPLFANLFSGGSGNKIESPTVYRSFGIFPESGGRTIISLTNNSAFLSEYRPGSGKLFLFSTAPVLEASDFPLKGIFAPLFYKTLFYLSARSREQVSFQAGSEIPLELKNFPLGQITVVKPDGAEEVINLSKTSSEKVYRYEGTDVLGNYRFLSNNTVTDVFSVNIDPNESVDEFLSEEEINDYFDRIGYEGTPLFINASEDITEILEQSRYGSELWKLLLFLAFIIALIESAVARSSKKDLAKAENPASA